MSMVSATGIPGERGLQESFLASEHHPWKTSFSYRAQVGFSSAKFEEISDVLLCQPQLNSSHLFRADILYDSAGVLKTPAQKEAAARITKDNLDEIKDEQSREEEISWPLPVSLRSVSLQGIRHIRTVVRRLIPRKPKLDRALEQTCYIFGDDGNLEHEENRLVIYRPHGESAAEIPWYHPAIKALAYSFYQERDESFLSVHFLPFENNDGSCTPERLHRIMLSLLNTLVRLSKQQKPSPNPNQQGSTNNSTTESPKDAMMASVSRTDGSSTDMSNISLLPSALKDTILPQHLTQDTYTRLKETYASDLMSRWLEATEPSKHVFEDLSIAAFLIELWKQMYPRPAPFPGFVDIACGNGVLVYILLKEGYSGFGFDARRRKTWSILGIDNHLTEQVCIPQPFLSALEPETETELSGTHVHTGIFPPSTFIISNHADELTPWTPLLSRLSSPESPNPFLAIPCCSHALSGARHRYSAKDLTITDPDTEQPATGDLKALRAAKKKNTGAQSNDKSMYGCLTRKVAALSLEVGCSVELTLMRIPSTRNIGIVGNRNILSEVKTPLCSKEKVEEIIRRECAISGGVEAAAKTWVEKARKLQTGTGRGKVNEKRHEQELA